jgi:hypothetical protein
LQFCCTERKKPEKRLHFITRALPQVARVMMSHRRETESNDLQLA